MFLTLGVGVRKREKWHSSLSGCVCFTQRGVNKQEIPQGDMVTQSFQRTVSPVSAPFPRKHYVIV